MLASLNQKQAAFVDAYIRTGNGAEAFRVAGYVAANYRTAAANVCRLLQLPQVRAAIDSILTAPQPPHAPAPSRHHPDNRDNGPDNRADNRDNGLDRAGFEYGPDSAVVLKPALAHRRKSIVEVVDEIERIAFAEPEEPLTWSAKIQMVDRLAKMHRLFSDGITINLIGASPASDLEGLNYDRFTDAELEQFERLLAIGRGQTPPDRGHDRSGAPVDAPVRHDDEAGLSGQLASPDGVPSPRSTGPG